jgi:hypothetical protein
MEKTYVDMEISRVRTNTSRTLYAVHHMGEVLVPLSGDPEHDACRAYEGPATHIRFFWKATGKPGLVMPVAWGKERKTREDRRVGPAVVSWEPFPSFPVEGKQADLKVAGTPDWPEVENG